MAVTLTFAATAAPFITLASPLYDGALEFTFTLSDQTVAGDTLHLDIATDSGFTSIIRSGDYTIVASDLDPEDAGVMPSFGFGLDDAPDGLLYARLRQTQSGTVTGYGTTSFTIAANVEMTSPPLLSAAIPKVGIAYSATSAGTADGAPTISFSWQWKVDGINGTGDGATGSGDDPPDYTPVVGDIGKPLTLTQTGSNDVPSNDSITSAESAEVVANTALAPAYIGAAGVHDNIFAPTKTQGPFTLGTPAAGRLIIAHIDVGPNAPSAVEIVGNSSTIAMTKRSETTGGTTYCAIYTATDTVNTTADIRVTFAGFEWAVVVQLASLSSGTYTSQATGSGALLNPSITNPTDGVTFIGIQTDGDDSAATYSNMTILDRRVIAPGGSIGTCTYVLGYNNVTGAQTPSFDPAGNGQYARVTITP